MAKIRRLQHAVFNCRDVEASMKFYTEVLGMEVVSYEPHRKAAFLTFGGEHHNIALFQWAKNTDMVNADHVGFNHLALEVEGGDVELKALHDHFVAQRVKIDRLSDHVISHSVYFFDPDGNRLEIFVDRLGDEAKQWMHDNGGVARPWAFEPAVTSRS